ncbi:MAG TPA: sugar ABC transporter ATP-binding protein [Polyangiales bacterium]|nr:sugar ABC transporter ATP-binding protein [Polyangiales bacterium]
MSGLLSMRAVHKRFGAVQALAGVDLEVARGEVHALIGENGAGKSTLMKILSGALHKDQGEIVLAGQPYIARNPLHARRKGVAMIYQELSLAPDLSVAQNILLGAEPARFGFVDRRAAKERVERALTELDHEQLRPERKVRELGPSARQLVEIARALVSDAQLLVLDEPTSSLTQHEVTRLFAIIERLRARGVAVIYISHVLEELERIADSYTVLRDGKSVRSGRMAEVQRAQLVAAMVGRELADVYPHIARERGDPVLELRELSGTLLPRSASLTLHRGEVLGIAGLIGAGRSELLRALYGLEPVARGTVRVRGLVDTGLPPWRRLAQGVGMVSEQRKEEGLWLELSVRDNLTMPALSRCTRAGFVDRTAQSDLTVRQLARLNMPEALTLRSAGTLSGGNQQKLALARLLCCDADVLLLDEPTRGIDVGSKAEIYRLIGQLAQQGKAVLMVSSYLPELLGTCDRIAVMRRGQLGAARPARDLSEAELLREAIGEA